MKAGKLDEYAVKARVFPAFLTLLPLGICAGQFVGFGSAIVAACSAFGGTALMSFVLAQWSRDAGKRKERELYRLWGGMPTTAYLRHRDQAVNPVVKARRYQRLQRLVPDLVLPSAAAEREDPADADQRYEAATKVLIQRTRDKERYRVLFQELIDYGFRRNLWGLKPVAITVLLLSIVFTLALARADHHVTYNLTTTAAFVLFLLIWLSAVTPNWVRRAAETYAERLFDALDEIADLDEPPTKKLELT
jgi:hypothetical protein